MAKIILQHRAPSHPFNEREIIVSAPVKIGRAVQGCKPGSDNGYFNCKVLSRNHAILWYEDGKFFLQDTQSSNGTFVNNQKLPAGTSQSSSSSTGRQNTLKEDPRNDGRKEIFSGDVLQFGVEVVEQAKKGIQPVTHGCILANIKAFHADGTEIKAPPSKYSVVPPPSEGARGIDLPEGNLPKLTAQEIYELQAVLQEAHHRELVLETKLNALNKILAAMESKDSWNATFQEDLLLSKIQYLQGQLQFHETQSKPKASTRLSLNKKDTVALLPSTFENGDVKLEDDGKTAPILPERTFDKKFNSDDYKIELMTEWKNMLAEREKFELIAKEAVQRALSEKLEASKALVVAEERLSQVENECNDLKVLCERTQKDLLQLVDKFTTQSQTLDEMAQTYQESERVKLECLEALKEEKTHLLQELDSVQQKLEEGKVVFDKLKRENIKLRKRLEGVLHSDVNGLDEDESSDEEDPAVNQNPIPTEDQASLPKVKPADQLFNGKKFSQIMEDLQQMSDFAAEVLAVENGEHLIAPWDEEEELAAPADTDYPYKNRQTDADHNKVPKKRSSKDRSYVTDDISFEAPPAVDAQLNITHDKPKAKKGGVYASIPVDASDVEIEQFLEGNRQLTELVSKLQAELETEREQVRLLSAPNTPYGKLSDVGEKLEGAFREQEESKEPSGEGLGVSARTGKFDSEKAQAEFLGLFDELSNTVASFRSSSVPVASTTFTSMVAQQDTSTLCSMLFLVVWMVFLAYFGAQH